MSCTPCLPGTHLTLPCTDPPTCTPCGADKYNDEWTTSTACKPCKGHCYGHEEIVARPCTRSQNLLCGCRDDYWHYKPGTRESKCIPFMECGKGYGVKTQGTKTSDVQCEECKEGKTYSDVRDYNSPCKACTRCQDIGVKQLQPCTTVKDATCNITTTTTTTTTTIIHATTRITTTMRPTGNGLSEGAIIGVSFGCVLLLIGIIVGIVCYRKRRNNGVRRPSTHLESGSQDHLNPDAGAVDVVTVSYTARGVRRRKSSVTSPPCGSLIQERLPTQRSKSDPHFDRKRSRSSTGSPPEPPPTCPKGIKQGKCLADVFSLVAIKFGGDGMKTFLRGLPSDNEQGRITDPVYDAIHWKHPDDLVDTISGCLDKWRSENTDRSDDTVIVDIFSALISSDREPLARELATKYGAYGERDNQAQAAETLNELHSQ